MVSMKNRELLRVEVVSKQSWLIYKLYSESGKFLCYMGQPVGDTRRSMAGETEQELLDNIQKAVSKQGFAKPKTK
jgi:hypothetical protein